ncbi:MAG: LacI family DNA-binding transcriptional regulator [Verrucomicrobia bacterium]|nr:LacI family DNA-binding transcriptional regulator [Verrucomicrobiota bacterium]
MPTIKEVAALAGVSTATVSRVINQNGYVTQAVQDKVRQTMEALNYQPSALARGLRRQKTQSIGVLVPKVSQPFFSLLGYAIEQALFKQGYRAFLCSAEENPEKESAYLEMLLRQRVDGIILVPTGHSVANVERLLRTRVPVVLVDRDLPALPVDRVLSDNLQGGYGIGRHLLDLGHRRIAVVGAEPHSESMGRRLSGIRRALDEAGVELREEWVVIGSGEQFGLGLSTAQGVLRHRPSPTAIVALTDGLAVGVLHGACRAGLQLPDELSVTGFDDIPLAAYVSPELTTVAQPITEMGERTVDRLLQLVQARWVRGDQNHDFEFEPQSALLPTRVVVRGSTAPPRASGSTMARP